MDVVEAEGRMLVAAKAYEGWTDDDLWVEYTTCCDAYLSYGDENERATCEAIGLALISRGVTAAQLANPLTSPFRGAA